MVLEHNGFGIWGGFCLTAEQRYHRLRVIVGSVSVVKAVQLFYVSGICQRDAGQRLVGRRDKRLCDMTDGIGQALHQFLRVETVVVFQIDTGNAFVLFYVYGNVEFGNIQFQALQLQGAALVHVAIDDTHLIGKHHLGYQPIVSGYLSKGVVLVAKGLYKFIAGLADIFLDRLGNYLAGEGERVDKHTHRTRYAQVAASTADGGDAQTLTIGKA